MSRSSIVFGARRTSSTDCRSNSRTDLEATEGTDAFTNGLNSRHGRCWRTLLAAMQHRFHGVRRTLKHGFDRSVAAIADPSFKTKLMGVHLDERAKADALYPPLYPDLNGACVHSDSGSPDRAVRPPHTAARPADPSLKGP